MKIMTIVGTRPEIIRLSLIIKRLDSLVNHVLVHTGQNFDPNLSDIFFDDLGIRKPDHYLGVKSPSFGEQIGEIISKSQTLFEQEKPDRILLLGDTNSALSALVAKRMGIPVFHMEAGNRCYDNRVPEEVNRRVIDHCSYILLPYTERSRDNLLKEGIENNRIYVTGNPIFEVIKYYNPQTEQSDIVNTLQLEIKKYFLVTLHRAENVDQAERLRHLLEGLNQIQNKYQMPIIVSTHPRTRVKIEKFGITIDNPNIRLEKPFSLFDFLKLEESAFCVLSDSGTVQEECCILKTPTVTLRDVTERPETIECGSNILSGCEPESIMRCLQTVLDQPPQWEAPAEYMKENVTDTVCKIMTGYLHTAQ